MKDSNPTQHNQDMNLDERFKRADPAAGAPALDPVIITGAITRAESKTPKARRNGFLVASISMATAIAVAITVPMLGSHSSQVTKIVASESELPHSGLGPLVRQGFAPTTERFNTWQAAGGGMSVLSGVAMISRNVTYGAAKSISEDQGTTQNLYKVKPTQSTESFANQVAQALELVYPLHISRGLDTTKSTILTTVTGGNIPAKQPSKQIGLTVVGGPGFQTWNYGDASALAYRPCRKGDSPNDKGVDMISHSADGQGHKSCQVLPSGLGPTKNQAIATAQRIFAKLGYRNSTKAEQVKDGELLVVATNWGSLKDNPARHSFGWTSAQVVGFLKVNGQITRLSQQISWSNSSPKIWNASGFGGQPVLWRQVPTIPVAQATQRISQYDGGPYSATPFFATMPSYFSPAIYSKSFTSAPVGQFGKKGKSKTKKIFATRFDRFTAVVTGFDGTRWLVPSYSFSDAGGYLGGTIAMRARDYAPFAAFQIDQPSGDVVVH
jgi:hypothetical protein